MKNIFLIAILMIGLLVSMLIGYQVAASDSSHPVPMAIGIVSGHPQEPATVVLASPKELATIVSSPLPETSISASVNSSIEATVGDPEPVAKGNFFTNNWGALLMGLLGFADLVTRLTPSVKDNSIFNFLSSILNAIIPNLKKGGGSF